MTFLQNSQKPVYKILWFFFLWVLCGGIWVILFFQYQWKSFIQADVKSFWQNTQVSDIWLDSILKTPKIQKTYQLIKDSFYGFERKNIEDIQNMFVSSLVKSLDDKHSEYFSEEDAKNFFESLSGDFEGIGAVVSEVPNGIKIDKVLKDSPAQKSWLEDGDIILLVDEKNMEGMKTSEAIKFIRWKKWTFVHLEILRWEEKKQIKVMRDVVNIASVEGEIMEFEWKKIGYIQVNSFGNHTSEEFLKQIQIMNDEKVEWLVLDFRFNGGGFLTAAQSLLSVFLPKNTPIVRVKENNPVNNQTLYTKFFSYVDMTMPIVVLVNDFSASASEIFAGAIQDYQRGFIIGTKTYGKGSVQETFQLWDGSMIKLTTAKWYTPNDKNIDEEWIIPDIEVEITEEDIKNKFDKQKEVAKKVLIKRIVENEKSYADIISESQQLFSHK